MRKQITQLTNLVLALEQGMLSISSVESKPKSSTDITATDQVTPDMFLEAIQFLNESVLFKNCVDFNYELVGENGIRIECGMKNRFLDEYYYVDCVIRDGFTVDDVDAKLRDSIFDGLAEKIAV